MTCSNCASENLKGSLYCQQCGEPLTTTAVKLRRDSELREKKARELELTEAVAVRFSKWSALAGKAVAGILVLFGLLLGKGYLDIKSDIDGAQGQVASEVREGTSQIHTSVRNAQDEITRASQELPAINTNIQSLRSDVIKYQAVNQRIEKLQNDVLNIQNTVVDLGHKTLKAQSVQTTGPGGASVSLGKLGCDKDKATVGLISLCAQGSPAIFNSMTPDGRTRPVASFSDVGFQDISNGPRPPCNTQTRGTVFIQKGGNHQSDVPFVCVKGASDEYGWLRLAVTN